MTSEQDPTPLEATACSTIRAVMGHQTSTPAILVCNMLGHVLLHQRDHLPTIREPGTWDVWGGYGEAGETPKAALITTCWLAAVIWAECRLRLGETSRTILSCDQ